MARLAKAHEALALALEKTSGLRRLTLRQNCLGDVAVKVVVDDSGSCKG